MLPAPISELLDSESLRWTFRVPADYPLFEGHFPGHPILPGVVALAWLLAAAERLLGHPVEATELVNVKFQVTILPGTDLELIVSKRTGGRLQATLRSDAGTHASALIPGQEG